MILFDTDVLVAHLRGDEDAVDAITAAGAEGRTTALTAAELFQGAHLSERTDRELARVDELVRHVKIVPLGPRAARIYGPLSAELLRSGAYPGLMDVLIASVALTEDAVLVTRDAKHFARIPGLRIEAW